MGATILVGEEGQAAVDKIVGIAVGYDDEGALRIEQASLDSLNRSELGRLASELRLLAVILERGRQVGRTAVH